MEWIFLVGGGIGGWAVAFFWSRSRSRLTESQLQENLSEHRQMLELQKQKLAEEEAKRVTLESDNVSLQIQLAKLGETLRLREDELTHTQSKNRELSEENRNQELNETRLKSETRHLSELLEKLNKDREELQKRMSEEFQNLANKIFEEKSEKMNQQATLKLNDLLNPFSENLKELRKKVEDTYQNELRDRSTLKGELKKLFELNQTLSQEANNLTKALKGENKTQGSWGELILETLLERSGLRKGFEYQTQESFTSEVGRRLQPDVVISLPDNRRMIIDSKVSLVAFERYVNADDSQQASAAGQDLVRSLKSHVANLNSKAYQELFPDSPIDFVLLFIPIEPAFATVLQLDGQLFQEAFEKHILIVSPSTLMATLKVVANIWRQENQNRNALEIARQAGSMYDKVVAIYGEIQKLGNQLQTVQKTYDNTVKMVGEGKDNLIRKVERLKELGAKTSKKMPETAIESAREEVLVESHSQDC